MRENRLLLATAVVVLLGCGSAPSQADDEKPGDKKPAPANADATPPDKKAEKTDDKPKKDEDNNVYRANVTDASGTRPFDIDDAQVWVPEVSILGGSGGKFEKKLLVRMGPAEIEVPFTEIAELHFTGVKEGKEDRLGVIVWFKGADKADKQLEGTVKANLQLKGKYLARKLDATIKLREVKTLKLEQVKSDK